MKLSLLAILAILVTFFSYAQQSITHKSIPNGEGTIRCHTMELDSIRRAENPSLQSLEENEAWLQGQISNYKNATAIAQKSSNLITIPIVFHILTDGVGADNVAATIIQEQVDQLNIDFRNLAGSADPVAADVEVEFCLALYDPSNTLLVEPGINRITTYGDGPFTSPVIDGTIKPATIWSPTEYLNVWVGDLSGGLLGWAQFPDGSGLGGVGATNGAANTDGVVAIFSSLGSVANPNPLNLAYGAGRTLTHQIGHWLGLRHIWGDGNCSVDDFCVDTPTSDDPNYGCPTTHVSCGTVDMVQNYMDYSDDACMNIFTADQKTRICTVLTVSPRRMELANSTKCGPFAPMIAFANAIGSNVNEITDCSYQDFTIDLTLSQAATADATVTISPSGSSVASIGQDFDILPSSVVFPVGFDANQQFTLRVYNDGVVEPDELLELVFSITTSGDAIATTNGNLTYSCTIEDDDIAPGNGNVILLSQDFESGSLAPFTTLGLAGSDLFQVGNTASASSAYWVTTGNATQFAYTNDDNCNCAKNNDRLVIPTFSLAGAYSSATLTFDHAFANEDIEIGEVRISTGGVYTTIAALSNTSVNTAGEVSTPWVNNMTVDLTPYIGQAAVTLQFRYRDGNGWYYGMAIDNVEVSAMNANAYNIQTVDNSIAPKSIPLKGFETVHYFDETTGDIMLSLENLSNWDYGCISVEVDRDVASVGNFTAPFVNALAADFLASKTLFIAPANNSPTGTYNVTLYYTEAEIAGWEAETGRLRSELEVIKVSNTPISTVNSGNFGSYAIGVQPATLGAFGTNGVTVTATFSSGFSGFGIGFVDPVILPVELVSFDGKAEGRENILRWTTASELNNSHFILRKSTDGLNFIDLDTIAGAGSTFLATDYLLVDDLPDALNYYQLHQFDVDGSEKKSNMIAIERNSELPVMISPNPAKDVLTIKFDKETSLNTSVFLYDPSGKLLFEQHQISGMHYDLNIAHLSAGNYHVKVMNRNMVVTKYFIKL